MTRASILFAIVAGVAPVASAQSHETQGHNSSDVQTVQRHREIAPGLAKARDLVVKHEFGPAKRELEEILGKVPESSEAHFLMAKVLYADKKYPEALDSMERAKQTLGVLVGLRMKMNEDRRIALEKRRYEQDTVIRNLNSKGILSLADQATLDRAQALRSDIDREIRALQEPTTARMPAEYSFFHGNILLRQQKYAEAAAEYDQALAADPAYADAANNVASLYYSVKQYAKAQEVLDRVEAKGATVNPELKKAIADALQ